MSRPEVRLRARVRDGVEPQDLVGLGKLGHHVVVAGGSSDQSLAKQIMFWPIILWERQNARKGAIVGKREEGWRRLLA